ncbi:MAG: hopanoid biosynthesis-associated protein HpnK, partial [Syntrophomonadaceae bacterium]
MRRLTVTGDDFGFSRGVNRAIVEAHRRGVLTHASLMVTGEAADDAIRLARAHPTLSVGLHLVLVDGRAALPPSRVPHLVDGDGRFRQSPVLAGVRAQFPPVAQGEVRQEVRGQIERFRETGLRLSHVDGHHHLHLHPVVLDTLAALAREFDIPAVRLPLEEPGLADDSAGWTGLGVALGARVFGRLRRAGERLLAPEGVAFAERVYGRLATGRLDEAYLLRLIPRIEADDVEIYCHPDLSADGEAGNGPPGAGR